MRLRLGEILNQASKGKLYLIGGGPGDPELLTIKAARVLGECDVVLYDRLICRETLKFARKDAEFIYVGKHRGEQHSKQREIFNLIKERALAGKKIARLKGGDPFIFGRGAEEWSLAIEHGIEVELVPGVSSATAVPALAGIPLTFRRISQSFVIVTGHCDEGRLEEWGKYAKVDTVVVLMGVQNRDFIARSLIQAGRREDELAVFIERGSMSSERVVESTLGEVAAGAVAVQAPAVLVIGEVARLRKTFIEPPRSRQ